jgi:hypothetical protein
VAEFVAPSFETDEINSIDVAYPRMQLMQPISEGVTDGLYSAGDIINAMTGEKIGGPTEAIEIFPIRQRKYYVVSNTDDNHKFVRIEPITTKEDMDKPWNFQENDINMKRSPTMEVFVYAPKHSELPFQLRFKGMTLKNIGKTFNTMAFMLPAAQKKAPFVRSLLISAKKEKNEKGIYFVFNFTVGKLADAETYKACDTWFLTTKTAKVENDEPLSQKTKPLDEAADTGSRF